MRRLLTASACAALAACSSGSSPAAEDAARAGAASAGAVQAADAAAAPAASDTVVRSDAEWRALLTPMQYKVLRQAGTERAFTGELWDEHRPGTYLCAGCGLALFSADTKFESGTGWPSFWQPIAPQAVAEKEDNSLFSSRVEIRCARCGGHLGHVFDDGPKPTGLRYCMNSAALRFEPAPGPQR